MPVIDRSAKSMLSVSAAAVRVRPSDACSGEASEVHFQRREILSGGLMQHLGDAPTLGRPERRMRRPVNVRICSSASFRSRSAVVRAEISSLTITAPVTRSFVSRIGTAELWMTSGPRRTPRCRQLR